MKTPNFVQDFIVI